LTLVRPQVPVWAGLSLIPLVSLTVAGMVYGYRPLGSGPEGLCGRAGARPRLGVGYVGCPFGQSSVWVQCMTSAECIIHSNGPCPRYGQAMVWSWQLVSYLLGVVSGRVCIS